MLVKGTQLDRQEIRVITWLDGIHNTGRMTAASAALHVYIKWSKLMPLNTLRQQQKGCKFVDDILECIFLNENVRMFIKISLNYVLQAPIYNKPTFDQIMAWHQIGNKPLSEPVMA